MGIANPRAKRQAYTSKMVSFKIFALLALAVGSHACKVEITTSEHRNVITPTCTLNCTSSPGYAQTAVNNGFRTEYRDVALMQRILRVCMKVGDNNMVEQCVVENDLNNDAAKEGPCVPATQLEVPSQYTKVGDKWMVASSESFNQDDARSFCANNNGFLARPRSLEENQAIADFMKPDHVLIGVNDLDTEDEFYFSEGADNNSAEKVIWTNWNNETYGGAEPNDNGNEDCVVMRSNKDYRWNDIQCWKPFRALCEWSGRASPVAG